MGETLQQYICALAILSMNVNKYQQFYTLNLL